MQYPATEILALSKEYDIRMPIGSFHPLLLMLSLPGCIMIKPHAEAPLTGIPIILVARFQLPLGE